MGPSELFSLIDNALSLLVPVWAVFAFRSKTSRFRGKPWILVVGALPCVLGIVLAAPVISRHYRRHNQHFPSDLAASIAAAPLSAAPAFIRLDGGYNLKLPAGFRTATPDYGPILAASNSDSAAVLVTVGEKTESEIDLISESIKIMFEGNQDFKLISAPASQPSGWISADFAMTKNGTYSRCRLLLRNSREETVQMNLLAPDSLFAANEASFKEIEASFKFPR